jgi:hypothetical protein
MGEILDRGSASITQDGRKAEVICSVYDGTDAGFGVPAWWGKYEDADAASQPQTGRAQITLEDGRTGEIIVRDARDGSGEFRGAGALS